jgi:hypothetical protein
VCAASGVALHSILGAAPYERFGHAVAGTAEVNGDGRRIFGARRTRQGHTPRSHEHWTASMRRDQCGSSVRFTAATRSHRLDLSPHLARERSRNTHFRDSAVDSRTRGAHLSTPNRDR